MTKQTMLKYYREYSAADSYILGFIYKHSLYKIKVNEIMPRYLIIDHATRNQGQVLRIRLNNKYKEQLIRKGATRIGEDELLIADKYNRGEIFEKIITESYGQTWEKDRIPFWVQGDICVNGEQIQIKLESAGLLTTKQIEKFKAKR